MTKLSEQIQSLLTYANGVTGEEDATLGDAVRTLADGYGQGGGELDAFINNQLESLTINENTTELSRYQFYMKSNLKHITLHDGITSIGGSCFYGAGITSIVIPRYVSLIPIGAFQSCKSLTNLILNDVITTIDDAAFRDCSSLSGSLVLPSTLTSIGDRSFLNTTLNTLTCKAITPPTIKSNSLTSTLKKILVPSSSIDAYKNATYWSTYASIIEAIPEE